MAKSTQQPLSDAARGQKELELARLRKLHASLPTEKKSASRQMERRMQELETALKGKGKGGNPAKAIVFALLALVVLAVSFVGIMAASHMVQS